MATNIFLLLVVLFYLFVFTRVLTLYFIYSDETKLKFLRDTDDISNAEVEKGVQTYLHSWSTEGREEDRQIGITRDKKKKYLTLWWKGSFMSFTIKPYPTLDVFIYDHKFKKKIDHINVSCPGIHQEILETFEGKSLKSF